MGIPVPCVKWLGAALAVTSGRHTVLLGNAGGAVLCPGPSARCCPDAKGVWAAVATMLRSTPAALLPGSDADGSEPPLDGAAARSPGSRC